MPRIRSWKNSAGKAVAMFSILSAKPKPFCISLLYAESFTYLIKLSKHRPPTACVLLLAILKLSVTVAWFKTLSYLFRNLRYFSK